MDYPEKIEPLYEQRVWRVNKDDEAIFCTLNSTNADGFMEVKDLLKGETHLVLPSDIEPVEMPDHYQAGDRVRFSFGSSYKKATILCRQGRYWFSLQRDDGGNGNTTHFWWLMPLHVRPMRPTQLTLF